MSHSESLSGVEKLIFFPHKEHMLITVKMVCVMKREGFREQCYLKSPFYL